MSCDWMALSRDTTTLSCSLFSMFQRSVGDQGTQTNKCIMKDVDLRHLSRRCSDFVVSSLELMSTRLNICCRVCARDVYELAEQQTCVEHTLPINFIGFFVPPTTKLCCCAVLPLAQRERQFFRLSSFVQHLVQHELSEWSALGLRGC